MNNCTGGAIGMPYKGVQAYSNAPFQGHPISCGGDADNNRGTYGFERQCVEFVRRFYATNIGINVGNIGDSWPKSDAVGMWDDYTAMGFQRFENGETTERPQPDDILVFTSTQGGENYGHVAIVVESTDNSVSVVEQNWSPTGYKDLPAQIQLDNTYYIPNRSSYQILGWMGNRSSIVYQPANDIGVQDIWTTSVYSYAPEASYPGGGLNNNLLRVGGWGDLYYSLIQFDLSNLPKSASKVEFQLYMPQVTGYGTTELYLDRITTFWDWRTQGTGLDRDRLWWADRPSSAQWIPNALSAPTAGQWYAIDITTLYNAWQAGTFPNYGVQLRPVTNWNTWDEFYSSNSSDALYRPKLVITSSAQNSSEFLSFPLPANLYPQGAYTTCKIISVLDHYMNSVYESPKITPGSSTLGTILSFTGELFQTTSQYPINIPQACYPKADNAPWSSLLGALYIGTQTPGLGGNCLTGVALNYEGHPGYDYVAAKGTPVYAAAGGTVVNSDGGCVPKGLTQGCAAWGAIGIDHGNGYISQYLHLDLSSPHVSPGESMSEGQQIGLSGNTAPPSSPVGPHLHFEVLRLRSGATNNYQPDSYATVDPYGFDTSRGYADYITQFNDNLPNICLWKGGCKFQ